MNKDLIILICFGIAILLFLWWFYHKVKHLNVPSVCIVTGGVKCGKSLLSVNLALKEYKKVYRKWWIDKHIFKKDNEMPLFYTNVNLSFGNLLKKKYHKFDNNIMLLSTEHLLRNERFNYKSIIYIQEGSLMSDNMDFQNKERNVDLSLFAKLIAHSTKGGKLYIDTQSILDLHYAWKRVCSSYLFILHNRNYGLFHLLQVREMINTENGVNSFNEDAEDSMKWVFIPFWYHYKYNRYEYSYLTDDLDCSNEPYNLHKGLISFNPLYISRCKKGGKK